MSLDHYVVKAGSTSRSLLIHLRAVLGSGIIALSWDTPGLAAACAREGEGRARPVTLVPGTPGAFTPGSFVEVNPELMPGLYEFGAPDEMLAEGSQRAVLMFRLPGTSIEPIDIDLVAYDPQDSVRLGMSAISPEARIQALRGAFPILTTRELAEQEALKEST